MSNYARFLRQLHQTESSLPILTIQAALAHHLANVQPLPTSLVATAITSKLFSHPFTLPTLQALQTAFRHALHLKYALVDNTRFAGLGIFAPSVESRLNEWVGDVMKGLQGGHAVMRLAAGTGVLLGLEDMQEEKKLEVYCRGKLEDEVVIALAEAMDLYKYEADAAGTVEWEKEFQRDDTEVSTLALCLLLSSQSLPLVSRKKLGALPLGDISKLLTSCVVSAFLDGKFLEEPHALALAKTKIFFNSIASLSKLQSLVLTLILESRSMDGVSVAASSLSDLRWVCARVEGNMWKMVSDSSSTEAWQVLKTLLFSCVMITEAALSASLYIPPNTYASSDLGSMPATLALCTLEMLDHLSFVVHQFGGVTSMGTPSEDGSAGGVFKEMRRTFYLALDILASGASDPPEAFVKNLCGRVLVGSSGSTAGPFPRQDKLHLAKISYTLACVEQLIPALSKETVSGEVWSVVGPHLYLPETAADVESLRETYEAAHSVLLAFFASNANTKGDGIEFVVRLVPFYVQCLIENSHDKKLSTLQLCMAFSALVRSACASAISQTDVQEAQAERPERYTLGWFCIAELVDAARKEREEGRLHRLRMALVSCVSAVPLVLLGEVLAEVKRVMRSVETQSETMPRPSEAKKGKRARATEDRDSDATSISKGPKPLTQKQELVHALYREVIEQVGDREKEYVVQWWYDNLELLGRDLEQGDGQGEASIEKWLDVECHS
ncbi:peroxisomal membrane protein [Moniliophthora roreri MCA 2997]|uniref:Peroxisomal membrane protein n=1 Tax=Moniliophthora roreri (strain MCA 2997) TaxID=1381753 RepID=V2XTE7_MONRO|nr:peroxisomal membrane protein [Moniliophthora roreri MCA 2997]